MISEKTASKKTVNVISNKAIGKKTGGKKATDKKAAIYKMPAIPNFEATPIIIKGKDEENGSSITAFTFSVSGLDFVVNTQSASGLQPLTSPGTWTTSTSEFLVGGIESAGIGNAGDPDEQFCQTTHLIHPLTVKFISIKKGVEDGNDGTIFFISETAPVTDISSNCGAAANCFITIQTLESFFKITKGATPGSGPLDWEASEATFSEAIDAIEVIDGEGTACCRFLVNPSGVDLKDAPPIHVAINPVS